MKSLAIIGVIGQTQAIKVNGDPDVFGPNGLNYKNEEPTQDMANIGIDITT
jgi:hypothetical protein